MTYGDTMFSFWAAHGATWQMSLIAEPLISFVHKSDNTANILSVQVVFHTFTPEATVYEIQRLKKR